MAGTDLILHEEEFRKITGLAEKLLEGANARYVALIDRNGQPLASSGTLPNVDRTALASLAAGNVAATEGLARMIGEESFSTLYHEGERDHIHISSVGGEVGILIVTFDERSSLGLVRLRVRQITPEMDDVFEEMRSRSSKTDEEGELLGTAMAEITDDDIDSLFGDRI